MPPPPITLFTYARPHHTRLTIEALLRNAGVSDHDLIVYSDAPRTPEMTQAVGNVRDYLKTLTGFRSVTIHLRPYNFGLAKSIVEGVTEVLSLYDRIIVLEDDMLTSPHFLDFMRVALDRFADDDRVVSVHGYVYPIKQALPEAFFLRGADCWGWATWRRGWSLFNPDGQALLTELRVRNVIREFDFNGSYGYSKILKGQIEGTNDSWAVRWYASAFLADKLTLYPGRSLVHNIGNDGSGTHCGRYSTHDTKLSETKINLADIKVSPSPIGFSAFERFFWESKIRFSSKIAQRLKELVTKRH